jgi:predicted flap endonuclease-1-like 5' DNA nuclease
MEKKKVVLTEVSGVGEKRASQLKAIGINSVDDLAKASVEDVAKRLKVSPKTVAVSPKIVAEWVASAKQLQQK